MDDMHIHILFQSLSFLRPHAEVGLYAVTDQLTKVLIVTKYLFGDRWKVICFCAKNKARATEALQLQSVSDLPGAAS